MRVVIDATALGSGLGGDETMLSGLLGGLALVARPDDAFTVLVADPALVPTGLADHPAFALRPVRRLPGPAHFGAALPAALRAEARRAPVDLVFSVTHAPTWSPAPVALMVQDLSFHHRPDDYPPIPRARLRTLVPRQARAAAAVLTVSEHARRDLLTTFALDPDRVHHVPNAVVVPPPPADADRVEVRRHLAGLGVTGPFVCYLGNLHPRKNVGTAIEGFARARAADPTLADHRFVIAGGRWWGSGEEEAAARAGGVVLLGRVDETTREVLLRDAEALVYLSRFEGFGLPPLEAMGRGTPVVAADATSLPEVTGGAAVLVDPDDPDAVAAALRRLHHDPAHRAALVEAGRARAAHYSLEATGAAARAAFAAALAQEVPVP